MIEIRQIDKQHSGDINIQNEPFELFGKMIPSLENGKWGYDILRFPPEETEEMCFPDENYCFDDMTDSVFLGAYDGEKCVGLAVLQPGFFKYMYLYDLKVDRAYRGRHIGKMLIDAAKETAARLGYFGLYTQGQDNNLAACLFYIKVGFCIGGFDSNVYRHTSQEEKADIIFYTECGKREGD